MRRSRAPWAVTGLLLSVAATGCATVAWPPPSASCIEVTLATKHHAQSYTHRGARVSRAEVENIVGMTPEAKRRVDERGKVVIGLALTGLGLAGTGNILAETTRTFPFLAASAVGFVLAITGWALQFTTEEPFHEAVARYNRAHGLDGVCSDGDEEKVDLPAPDAR